MSSLWLYLCRVREGNRKPGSSNIHKEARAERDFWVCEAVWSFQRLCNRGVGVCNLCVLGVYSPSPWVLLGMVVYGVILVTWKQSFVRVQFGSSFHNAGLPKTSSCFGFMRQRPFPKGRITSSAIRWLLGKNTVRLIHKTETGSILWMSQNRMTRSVFLPSNGRITPGVFPA